MVLRDNYRLALELAVDHGYESVAFPVLGTGGHGYPQAEAVKSAVEAVAEFLGNSRVEPTFVEFVTPDTDVKALLEQALEAESVAPETREHDVFGGLEFKAGVWNGTILINEYPVTVELYGEDVEDRACAPSIKLIRSQTASELVEPVAGEYLDLLNAHWRERSKPYSLSEFLEMLRVVHIGVEDNGHFMISLEAANVFEGHQINLEYDENGQLLDSYFG
jgi:hypothetical protein